MKAIRLLAVLVASGTLFAPSALGAKAQNPVNDRLLGRWEEYAPSDGVVQFDPDHSMRFYLTKEEGTKKNMRWIEAKWTLTSRNVIRLRYFANRKLRTRTIKLAFKNDELWLTEKGKTSRYRRLNGELPAQYNWQ